MIPRRTVFTHLAAIAQGRNWQEAHNLHWLRLKLPFGNSPEFSGLLHDPLLAAWTRAEAHGLSLNALSDPETLPSR